MYVINLFESGNTLHRQTFFFYKLNDVFSFIDAHKDEKIVLFEVGKCLIDWS